MGQVVSIPGKVMISGEYSVLSGGKSILFPVDKSIQIRESNNFVMLQSSPVLRESAKIDIPRLSGSTSNLTGIDIDYSEFYAERKSDKKSIKLGLGSSAAEAVGIIALRYMISGLDWTSYRDEISEIAFKAHWLGQGKRGSGADVVTCAMNQPIEFTLSNNNDLPFSYKSLKDECSDLVTLNLFWSGIPSNTRDKVDLYHKWVKSEKSKGTVKVEELVKAANHLADAWFEDDSTLFDAIDRSTSLLLEMSAWAGFDYWLNKHLALDVWAKQNGGRIKATGAGGGDLILLVGDLPLDELDGLIIPLSI